MKGFVSLFAYCVANETIFGVDEMVDGYCTRPERTIGRETGHGHESVFDRSQRLISALWSTLDFVYIHASYLRSQQLAAPTTYQLHYLIATVAGVS
jgi:hypothetical protein